MMMVAVSERTNGRMYERTEAQESHPPCPDASMRRPNKRERSERAERAERAERDAQEERIRNRSRAREGDEGGKGEREKVR